jgi:hypothetical protein
MCSVQEAKLIKIGFKKGEGTIKFSAKNISRGGLFSKTIVITG